MSVLTHELVLIIERPNVVTEGEAFEICYKVGNRGPNIFPGGTIIVEITWSSLNEKVYQPINVSRLSSGEETNPINYNQAPLTSGYTWFYVANATATDGNAVTVVKEDGPQLWPYQQVNLPNSIQTFRRPLDAVRARTHEEITEHRALKIAAFSLVLLVIFQLIDWIFSYYQVFI